MIALTGNFRFNDCDSSLFQSNGRALMRGITSELSLILNICKRFGKPNFSNWPTTGRSTMQFVRLPNWKAPPSAGEALVPKLDSDGKDLFNVSSFSPHLKILSSDFL
jgi:hypothetical protein